MNFIAWMFWSSSGGLSNHWSKSHALKNPNNTHTICGQKIPEDSFRYDRKDPLDWDSYCKKCEKHAPLPK